MRLSEISCHFLLAADLYSQAHDVICDETAPEAILSETCLELEELLALLADPERFSTIADWYLIRAPFA
jgi:hypothetical protein